MSWQVGIYGAAILAPLVAFMIGIAADRRLGRRVAYLALTAIGISFVLSLVGFATFFLQAPGLFTSPTSEGSLVWRGAINWVVVGATDQPNPDASQTIPLGIEVDSLTALMFVMVTFIATVVHVFAIGYMKDDPRFPRFFSYLALFCFAMLGLVAASNLFFIFVFWELVGFCSYLLIGFWLDRGENADAANKAFLVNRIGDFGMIVGLGLIWSQLGTLDIRALNTGIRDDRGQLNVVTIAGDSVVEFPKSSEISGLPKPPPPRTISYPLLVVAGLGIFAGCVGKSAQFPLHVWLPDAMAGPTPVSALIHAATMVAAGVYLVGRVFPLFTPEVLLTIAYTGAITVFIAATIAIVQSDYKKVLAYSTVSQLGFMMVGLGVGGRSSGLFHLLTHACFKALLFLGAGSVYHSVHTYEMADLGGLYRRMRLTGLTMLVATLAISGVPLTSGFASKDAVLASSLQFVIGQPEHFLLFLLPSLGAAITAFYMFRLWFLLFAGKPRTSRASRAVEGGRLLTWPLVALAVPSVVIGWPVTILPWFGFPPILEQLLEYGEPIESIDPGGARWWAMGASVLVLSVGFGLGALTYGPWDAWRRLDPKRSAHRFGPIHDFLVRKWYFDELYRWLFLAPTLAIARATRNFDRFALDGIVDGSARLIRQLSRFEGIFDRVAVDRLVGLIASGVHTLGDRGRRLQTGNIRTYLMMLTFAVVGLLAALLVWVRV